MKYRSEIDGLRTIAVVPVVLFHAGVGLLSGGYVGVDVFFVISGYLITGIILRELEENRFSIVNFYERRARRILPALFVVMLACLPFAWMWMLPGQMRDFGRSLIAVSTFTSNILFWQEEGYFAQSAELKPLLHTWSLAVEEQFYIFFPILCLVIWKLGQRSLLTVIVILSVLSLALTEYGWRYSASANFYLIPSRAWELGTGAICAIVLHHRGRFENNPLSLLGLGLIVFAIFAYDATTPFPSLYTLVPVLGTALVIAFASPRTWAGRLLSLRPLVGIGLISYSTYLWHQPLLAFARLQSLDDPSLGLMLGLATLSFVLGYLSWKYVETPFRKPQDIGRKAIFASSLAGLVAFIAVGGVIDLVRGLPSRLDYLKPEALAMLTAPADALEGTVRKNLVLGNDSRVTSAIIGDSHAGALAETIAGELVPEGEGLLVVNKNGCPPVTGLIRLDNDWGSACDRHNAAVYDAILADPDIATVYVAARYTLYLETTRFDNGEGGVEHGTTPRVLFAPDDAPELLGDDLARQAAIAARFKADFTRILEAGKKLVVIYPVPEVGWDLPARLVRLARREGPDAAISTSLDTFTRRHASAFAMLDALPKTSRLERIYPHEGLCGTHRPGRCQAALDGIPLYSDDNHLNQTGAYMAIGLSAGTGG